ncbi:unnamed protein product [Microthlaspi erraticum]|uniref:Reverse transcriptase domain-containing protein n=1 Tax=Microthlaspi erraticum TaxID=1685480 RepID=A0A6D2JVZ1_9BRAS|nr:unnamed protein product [Microthlaspi erraticum]
MEQLVAEEGLEAEQLVPEESLAIPTGPITRSRTKALNQAIGKVLSALNQQEPSQLLCTSSIPSEIHFPGVRRRLLPEQEGLNHLMLLDELDLVNERHDGALIRIQNYQQATARYYNTNVRSRRFRVGDLVLRKVLQNTAELNAGKLGANWEGPYRITDIV